MMRRLWSFLLIPLILVLVGCAAAGDPTGEEGTEPSVPALTNADIQRVTVAEANELLGRGLALLYDTRTLEEYRTLHAAGALPFPEAEMTARYDELPFDQTIIFY